MVGKKLKSLIKPRGAFERQVVARSILNVPYFPYASRTFGHSRLRLPSQDYSFRLVQEAVSRHAIVVLMRTGAPWLTAVKELNGYEKLYCVRNTQNPVIRK